MSLGPWREAAWWQSTAATSSNEKKSSSSKTRTTLKPSTPRREAATLGLVRTRTHARKTCEASWSSEMKRVLCNLCRPAHDHNSVLKSKQRQALWGVYSKQITWWWKNSWGRRRQTRSWPNTTQLTSTEKWTSRTYNSNDSIFIHTLLNHFKS